MNQIKKELEKELRSVTLSEEKKQSMLKKMNRKKRANWSYRFVLAACTLLGLGFSYLLFTEDFTDMNHAARPEIPLDASLFSAEQSRVLIMFGFYIVFYLFMKFLLRRKTLAVCASCGEEWTFGQSLKASMKNKKVRCPHCLVTQEKTEKTIWEMTMLQWIFPLGIVFSQPFDHVLRGFFIYTAFAVLIVIRFAPYLMSFKGEEIDASIPPEDGNPKKEMVMKWVKICAPIAIILIVMWAVWEGSESHPTPQEAIYEMYYDATLIPGYLHEDEALFFSIAGNKLISAHYVDKNLFGWKAKRFTSYPVNDRSILDNNYGESTGKRHVIYGLIEPKDDWIVQVDGEDARLLNVETLPAEEVALYDLEGLFIWYYESNERIDTAEVVVQVVNQETGEVVEGLSFD